MFTVACEVNLSKYGLTFDPELEKLIGDRSFSGAGWGRRDMGWEFKTLTAAQAAHDKLVAFFKEKKLDPGDYTVEFEE